jgi:hypothetical protein
MFNTVTNKSETASDAINELVVVLFSSDTLQTNTFPNKETNIIIEYAAIVKQSPINPDVEVFGL